MAVDRDPRSEAEKARAALKRNAEMGGSVSQSPLTRQPSVTPENLGEQGDTARALSGSHHGVEAGGAPPARERGGEASQSIAEAEQVATGRDTTRPVANRTEAAPAGKK